MSFGKIVEDDSFHELWFILFKFCVIKISRLIGHEVHSHSVVFQHVIEGFQFKGMQNNRIFLEDCHHFFNFRAGIGQSFICFSFVIVVELLEIFLVEVAAQ